MCVTVRCYRLMSFHVSRVLSIWSTGGDLETQGSGHPVNSRATAAAWVGLQLGTLELEAQRVLRAVPPSLLGPHSSWGALGAGPLGLAF